jgi:hypothetical protein
MWRCLISLAGVLAMVACSEPRTPVASSPLTPPATVIPVPPVPSITGIVFEVDANGRRPLGGAGIDISPEYQSWQPAIFTDHDGRFMGPGRGAVHQGLKIIATRTGYSQPCRVSVSAMAVDHEVYLVSNELLSTTGVPLAIPLIAPVMTGRVFERTPLGDEPIAGAAVVIDFTGGDGWAPSATTMTDVNGRYVVCNVVNASGLGLAALVTKLGYIDRFVGIGLEAPATFDVELHRR